MNQFGLLQFFLSSCLFYIYLIILIFFFLSLLKEWGILPNEKII